MRIYFLFCAVAANVVTAKGIAINDWSVPHMTAGLMEVSTPNYQKDIQAYSVLHWDF